MGWRHRTALLAIALLCLFAALQGRCSGRAEELLFFCGSAAKAPIDEIISRYTKQTGVTVRVTYGGSGTLLSQMELSRRGDLYLSGSPDYIAIGERRKLLVTGTARKAAWLVPAIIVPKGNPGAVRSLEDLARPGVRVGLGNPETVCLGLYAVELLAKNRLLARVMPNVAVFAKSCEDTAMLAVLRKVDAVIGWDVFAAMSPGEVEWVRIPGGKIPRISCIMLAIPVFARNQSRSRELIAFVRSPEGRSVFRRRRYLAEEREARRHAPGAAIGGEYALPDEYFRLLRREE